MNVEKTFGTMSKVLSVIFVTALVAMGGTWAYENWTGCLTPGIRSPE